MSSQSTVPHPLGASVVADDKSPRSDAGDAASILSSRMTDIASDDGEERRAGNQEQYGHSTNQRQSVQTIASRPNTAKTGISTQRGTFSHAPATRRAPLSGSHTHRGSGVGSISGAPNSSRPLSSARSQGPSITSQAFFRPMSSQKLQAQRAGSRPATTTQQGAGEGAAFDGTGDRRSFHYFQTARDLAGRDERDTRPPPSRGTEMTEQETVERMTANTSPTQGHYPAGSVSESVRPLQRNTVNTKGLSLDVNKSEKNTNNLTSPGKSPRSFRSSFLLPTRGDHATSSPHRSTQGREKLSSVASSPGLASVDTSKRLPKTQAGGSNYQYFQGSTVFCWGGRLQNSRDKPVNIVTGLLVTLPAILFLVFSAPWLWHNASPAIPIVFGYVFFLCISSFLHASASDPGVS